MAKQQHSKNTDTVAPQEEWPVNGAIDTLYADRQVWNAMCARIENCDHAQALVIAQSATPRFASADDAVPLINKYLSETGDHASALAMIELIISRIDKPRGLLTFIRSYLSKQGSYSSIRGMLDKAISLCLGQPDNRFMLLVCDLFIDQADQALHEKTAAVALIRHDLTALYDAAEYLGETQEAIGFLKEAMNLAWAENDRLIGHLIAFKLQDMEEYDAAIACYEKLALLEPDKASIRFQIGECYRNLGDKYGEQQGSMHTDDQVTPHMNDRSLMLALARTEFERAATMHTDDPQQKLALGIQLLKLGSLELGRTEFEKGAAMLGTIEERGTNLQCEAITRLALGIQLLKLGSLELAHGCLVQIGQVMGGDIKSTLDVCIDTLKDPKNVDPSRVQTLIALTSGMHARLNSLVPEETQRYYWAVVKPMNQANLGVRIALHN